jgi:hypothetical protein
MREKIQAGRAALARAEIVFGESPARLVNFRTGKNGAAQERSEKKAPG